jgi:KaiC/GvpD/RAD55 family RecA-like ATPase
MAESQRLAFGLPKFDKIIQGGIPEKTCVSVTGPPGVGKSLLALHFLLDGLRKGERCVYIHLNEAEESILRMIHNFSFGGELEDYMKKETLRVTSVRPDVFTKEKDNILKRLSERKYSRIVIDGFNVLISDMEKSAFRSLCRSFLNSLKDDGRTSLIVCEMDNRGLSSLEKTFLYSVDGIIFVDFMRFGASLAKTIFVPKMRYTKQEDALLDFSITSEGIDIKSDI